MAARDVVSVTVPVIDQGGVAGAGVGVVGVGVPPPLLDDDLSPPQAEASRHVSTRTDHDPCARIGDSFRLKRRLWLLTLAHARTNCRAGSYQIRTRSGGGRNNAAPGRTLNAAYQSSMFRTVCARYWDGA